MKQKTKISYVSAIVLALVFGAVSLAAVAKSENANSGNANSSGDTKSANIKVENTKNVKTEKTAQLQVKNKVQTTDLVAFEKPDNAKGESNAKLHTEKTAEVTKSLNAVAKQEKGAGNTEVGNQIQKVALEQVQTQSQTSEAIAQVENRSKVKNFIAGTDYKNLGQLRSSLVQNRNDIRKLTQALTQVQTADSQTAIELQLQALTQERERIKSVISTNEDGFSLFGWLSRWMNGYQATPVDTIEEEQLTTEVQDAINDAPIY